jgi:hypothetical protein
VAWPLPELDVGVDDGELRPDDELPDDFDVPDPLLLDEPDVAEPELAELELAELELAEPELELPLSDLALCVLVADDPVVVWEAAEAAPGRLTATTPAAAMLAAAAETVATRSRLRPRSRSAMAGEASRAGLLCLLMPRVLPRAFGWRSRFPLSNL